MRLTSLLATTAVAGTLLLAAGAPAATAATGAEIGGSGAEYHLTNGWAGKTDRTFVYGRGGDRVYVGDWNGDGTDTLAVRRGSVYHFSNRLTGGNADQVVAYGRAGDTVLMGDWDGDGKDTPVVRRGATYHFTNHLRGGPAEQVIVYGRPGDDVMVGDWDGDGRDSLGVRRGATYHLKNAIAGGKADHVVTYGRGGDSVIVGDWDGDGKDTLGVQRGSTFHIKNRIAPGNADQTMAFGRSGDGVLVGDWDGNGTDTIGLRRAPAPAPAPAVPVPWPGNGAANLDLDRIDAQMVDLLNAERTKRGLQPLQTTPGVRAAAAVHSSYMARTKEFAHPTWESIASDVAKHSGCAANGENIQTGSPATYWLADPAEVIQGYMNSPGHRQNILEPSHTHVGIATVIAEDGSFFNTQRFAIC